MSNNNLENVKSWKKLSDQDFLSFGIQQIAYVKMVEVEDKKAFAIHAADGTPLTIMDSYNDALVVARQNDLEPVTVH